ncbi:MAG: toll/interleukin-1 receptor domain-containing protein, partial [Methylococcales bacterium]|nr:toll/interleukin-1 receptor domain-containing protein [Methylococcales bacterium]
MTCFFISYTPEDEQIATWIASTLEDEQEAGKAKHSVTIEAWDFVVGGNLILETQTALIQAERVILILSPSYLASAIDAPEWAVAFASDPAGFNKTVVPIKVKACKPQGFLQNIITIDLVGQGEVEAKKLLLTAISGRRRKPRRVAFPGEAAPQPEPTPSLPEILPHDSLAKKEGLFKLVEIRIMPAKNNTTYPIELTFQGNPYSKGTLQLDPMALAKANDAESYGKLLGQALFAPTAIGTAYGELMAAMAFAGHSMRVRLRLDDAPTLHQLAWERLHHSTKSGWQPVATTANTPFSR